MEGMLEKMAECVNKGAVGQDRAKEGVSLVKNQ